MQHAPLDPLEALGDAQRREILRLLGQAGPRRAADRRRPADQPAGGLAAPAPAQGRRPGRRGGAGTRRIYRLREEGVQAVQAYLERVWGEAAARFRLLAENTEAGAP